MPKISQDHQDFYNDAQLVELCKQSIRATLKPHELYAAFSEHHGRNGALTTIQVSTKSKSTGARCYLGTLKALADLPESALLALIEAKQGKEASHAL